MPPREDDAVAPRAAAPRSRTLLLAGGFALAASATLAVFLTDNPQYLRVAVVAVAWAFVLAMFAAGRRDTDRVAAAARETELRQTYEAELDREVAARREYELELEHELRREAEDSMRYELDALRGDISALAGLRDEVARVSELRGDIAALSGLRDEVARVAALRDDVAALMVLRQDLGQLAELRADMGRLRAELTEQLSSEMLVERIVMRTQASRMPAEPVRLDGGPGRALETSSWAVDVPPRELTGCWPAIRLDEPREASQFGTSQFDTSQFDEVRIERSGIRPPVPDMESRRYGSRAADRSEPVPWDAPLPTWGPPGTSGWAVAPAAEDRRSRYAADEPAGPPPTTMSAIVPSSIARPPAPLPPPPPPVTSFQEVRRPQLARPPVPPPVTPSPPSPIDWLAARSLLDGPSSSEGSPHTSHRPAVPPPPIDRGGYRAAVRDEPATAPGAAQEKRLADILAENGVSPSAGGRRRRRYRDEDEPDDVLARVLRQS